MTSRPRAVITDYDFPTLEPERRVLEAAGVEMVATQSRTEQELIDNCRAADALLVEYARITRPVIESLERCKVIVRYGVGYDNLDVEAASACRIWACNVPDYSIDEVSDHALALLLALGRKIVAFNAGARAGRWDINPGKPVFRLQNQTLGVLGYGRIGAALGRKAAGIGMRVLAHDPYLSEAQIAERGAKSASFEAVLHESDFVSVHSPLTSETHHLINERSLALMKPTAFLINTSRGPLIDSDALACAIGAGTIAGAGLDVLEREPISADHPLLGLENVILTPHIGYYSEESFVDLKTRAAEEVVRVLQGGRPKNPLNEL